MKKEYELRCECGSTYRFQGTEEDLKDFLDSETWMCETGRHVEIGRKRDYLTLVGESDELLEPDVEPKGEGEYTVQELQEEFGTSLEHIGFGIFRDPDGNTWDYRSGPKGERLYSKR